MRNLKTLTRVVFIALATNIMFCSCAETNANEIVEEKKTVVSYLTLKVENEPTNRDILIRGSVNPVNKVMLTAEVQGMSLLNGKAIKAGTHFKKGEVVLAVDANETEYSLHASRSKYISAVNRVMATIQMEYASQFEVWQAYLNNYDLESALPKIPHVEDPKLKNYLISNSIYELYYSVKSQEARFEKYNITAPFNGSITAAYTQKGEMLMPNMKIAEFSGDYAYEMEASISLKDLPFVTIGQEIELRSNDFDRTYTGKVMRVNEKLEDQTQSLKIYLLVKNADMKGGMFLEGNLASCSNTIAYTLPRKLLKRNNEVYVIRNSVVHLVTVSPLFHQDNMVVVSGLQDGDLLINEVINTPITGTQAQSKN